MKHVSIVLEYLRRFNRWWDWGVAFFTFAAALVATFFIFFAWAIANEPGDADVEKFKKSCFATSPQYYIDAGDNGEFCVHMNKQGNKYKISHRSN